MRQPRRDGSSGQILVLFTLALVALLAMLGLLFDGGNALALRRQLQNAGDAGALAAANMVQGTLPRGCSATEGPPPGAPQAAVVTAARAGARASLPWLADSDITVTCPDGWSNFAVQVDVAANARTLFGRVVGITGLRAATTSQALNGQVNIVKYSIVTLDPWNPGWPQGRRGCPALLISGTPTIVLEGSVAIDSACTSAAGGALATNGSAATVTLVNDATFQIVGEYKPSSLTISPTPAQHQPYVKDPLLGLPTMPTLPGAPQSSSTLTINGTSRMLEPGVYIGGIELKSSAKVFLRPGIYIIKGGDFKVGAQAEVYSIVGSASSTTSATWATDCPIETCGILIYNTSNTTPTDMGQISIGAGAVMKMRPYRPNVDRTLAAVSDFANLLIWQDAAPAPTSSYAQPELQLSGGGTVDLSGTIYAPSAKVSLGGGSGGSGGSTDLTLQFVSWDLELGGTSSFIFRYRTEKFAKPTDYGLIK